MFSRGTRSVGDINHMAMPTRAGNQENARTGADDSGGRESGESPAIIMAFPFAMVTIQLKPLVTTVSGCNSFADILCADVPTTLRPLASAAAETATFSD